MKRGLGRSADFELDHDVDHRSRRRGGSGGPRVDEARDAWEPIVCPDCGAGHPDTSSVRLKRSGPQIHARCGECGTIAARYMASVWSA